MSLLLRGEHLYHEGAVLRRAVADRNYPLAVVVVVDHLGLRSAVGALH